MKEQYRIAILLAILIILSSGIAVITSGRTITGGIVGGLFSRMPAAYSYFLISLFVVGIIFNIAYMRFANVPEAKMGRLIKQTRKHIKKDEHEKAQEAYEEARLQYSKLGSVDKIRLYDTIMNVYNELLATTRAQEAKDLAEKYAAGEITSEELQRLEMILRGY